MIKTWYGGGGYSTKRLMILSNTCLQKERLDEPIGFMVIYLFTLVTSNVTVFSVSNKSPDIR